MSCTSSRFHCKLKRNEHENESWSASGFSSRNSKDAHGIIGSYEIFGFEIFGKLIVSDLFIGHRKADMCKL